jgi:putative ABC transport system ATP-binding protein
MKIDARQISLIYTTRLGQTVTALDEMDFTIREEEMVGVLGPSGSGKSSLLYVLSGLKKPSAGTVFYDDTLIEQWSREYSDTFRRKHFGFIFQRHYLINHLTMLENVMLPFDGPAGQSRDRAMCLLEKVHLEPFASRMPGELSVGQRQLAAVARALVNNPDVIFADEPTASLDMATGLSVMDLIASEGRNAAVVIVTHDVKMLQHSHRILKLRDGRPVPDPHAWMPVSPSDALKLIP